MDVIAQNVHWLIPDENSPCDIFLHFRGQFPQAVNSGQPITTAVLEKLAKVKCHQIFIRRADLSKWEAYTRARHAQAPSAATDPSADGDAKELYGNKRAELVSYLQKAFQKRVEGNSKLDEAMAAALEAVQKVARSPMLDWYFQQFHEPPNLFYHCGRVAYAAAIFSQFHRFCVDKDLETLIFATLIHELEGDPATSLKTIVSQQTIASLEKSRRPVPAEVIALITLQDELCSGKGFPMGKNRVELPVAARVFTLFNHFDHYRLKDAPSRRAKFDMAKQQMSARKADYDTALWDGFFWEFWEKYLEIVT